MVALPNHENSAPSRSGDPIVLAIVLLAALFFRAYIPVGFMPASGTPFLVELCPAYGGAPAHHGHHHHSQGQADFQDCPFGSTPAPGPVSHLVAFEPAGRITSFVEIPAEPARPAYSAAPRSPAARTPFSRLIPIRRRPERA